MGGTVAEDNTRYLESLRDISCPGRAAADEGCHVNNNVMIIRWLQTNIFVAVRANELLMRKYIYMYLYMRVCIRIRIYIGKE